VRKPETARICILEGMYFARADGDLEGTPIYDMRMNMGRYLAEKDPDTQADMVVSVPDSARAAAQGFAEVSGIPYREGFMKNTNKRSFLQNDQKERQKTADQKLRPIRSVIKDRDVIVVEDSIVRGTTLRNLVTLMKKEFQAGKVHLRIASPPALWTCRYGIDIPTREELIAYQKGGAIDAIREYIGADSLQYLEIADAKKAVGGRLGRMACDECFTGKKISAKHRYFNPFDNAEELERLQIGRLAAVA